MSYTEIAIILAEIAEMTAAPETLDEAVRTDWFSVAQKVNQVAAQTKAKVEAEDEAHFEQMCRQYDEQCDAQFDAISAGWGHD